MSVISPERARQFLKEFLAILPDHPLKPELSDVMSCKLESTVACCRRSYTAVESIRCGDFLSWGHLDKRPSKKRLRDIDAFVKRWARIDPSAEIVECKIEAPYGDCVMIDVEMRALHPDDEGE